MDIGGISARDPKNLRWRTESFEEKYEILVLCENNRVGSTGCLEDLQILGAPQAESCDGIGFDAELLAQPGSQMGRELRVDPEDQAARTAWSRRWLAKRRLAWMSSDSRSGISSRICSAVKPLASRSRTSLTRIRIPRMQGRPPHCSGSTVMRSATYLMLFPPPEAYHRTEPSGLHPMPRRPRDRLRPLQIGLAYTRQDDSVIRRGARFEVLLLGFDDRPQHVVAFRRIERFQPKVWMDERQEIAAVVPALFDVEVACEGGKDLRRPHGLRGIVLVDRRSDVPLPSDRCRQGKKEAIRVGNRCRGPLLTGRADILVKVKKAAGTERGRCGGETTVKVFHMMKRLVEESGVEPLSRKVQRVQIFLAIFDAG